MARLHFVKKARKDNPVAKRGESYYWWKPRIGGRGGAKRYSKERPTRAQMTQSEFMSRVYEICDSDIPGCESADDLNAVADSVRELGQEQEEKLDNMPDGLRDGDTGQLLQERVDGCEEWADEIARAADDIPDEPEEPEEPEEGCDPREQEAYEQAVQER